MPINKPRAPPITGDQGELVYLWNLRDFKQRELRNREVKKETVIMVSLGRFKELGTECCRLALFLRILLALRIKRRYQHMKWYITGV